MIMDKIKNAFKKMITIQKIKRVMVGWLVGFFYDISTFVGYLMPNPVYVFIKYISFVSK